MAHDIAEFAFGFALFFVPGRLCLLLVLLPGLGWVLVGLVRLLGVHVFSLFSSCPLLAAPTALGAGLRASERDRRNTKHCDAAPSFILIGEYEVAHFIQGHAQGHNRILAQHSHKLRRGCLFRLAATLEHELRGRSSPEQTSHLCYWDYVCRVAACFSMASSCLLGAAQGAP